MSASENKQLQQFLEFFCDLEKSPYYALMIKGPWGSGKTFIIKRFMDSWSSADKPYLYISLYGISESSQIDDALFSAMHPVLGSKAVKIGGRILKGTLKAALKIDLDGDGKDDGTVSLQLPDFSLVESLSTNGYVLVFDDLERCSIPIADVMGYINRFVEHGGQKVIVISNEEDIEKSDLEKGSRYTKIKEKLIGKTFEVQPQISDALTVFIDEVAHDKAKDFLSSKVKYVSDVYMQSETKNLRILRHAINDFSRLFHSISDERKTNDLASKHLLGLMLCLCFEIRSGNVKPAEIGNIIANFRIFSRRSADEREKELRQIAAKYTLVNLNDGILPTERWIEIVDQSYIDREMIEADLAQSGYYETDTVEEWRTLWHAISVDEAEFSAALRGTQAKIDGRYYHDQGVILHITGILIELASHDLYDKPPDEIETKMKAYVDDVVSAGRIKENSTDTSLRLETGYAGLGFQCSETSQFRAVASHLKQRMKEYRESKYPEIAQGLLDLMHADAEEFLIRTCHTNSKENVYADVPVFVTIEPDAYIQKVRSADIKSQYQIFMAFKMRYDHHALARDLAVELPWVQNVQAGWKALKDVGPLEANRLRIYRKNYVDNVGP